MELRPGEKIIDGEVMYSAAFLDSWEGVHFGHVNESPWDPTARRNVRHARLIEAWATCYVYVCAIPRALDVYGRSIIHDVLAAFGFVCLVALILLLSLR